MARTKSQHYVPRTYLRRFCFEDERIHVFDKAESRSFVSSIENVAQENYFYDVAVLDEQGKAAYPAQQQIEEQFSKIEFSFAGASETLLDESCDEIPDGLMQILIEFVIAQSLRTRETRELSVELETRTSQVLLWQEKERHFPGREDLIPMVPTIDETFTHLQYMSNTENWEALRLALGAHVWRLGVHEGDHHLITSDHPVVRHGTIGFPYPQDGFASPGVGIFLPISPWRILIILDRQHNLASTSEHRSSVRIGDDTVQLFNEMQVGMSYRRLFASTDEFGFVSKMIETVAEMADPNRKRVGLSGGPFGKEEF